MFFISKKFLFSLRGSSKTDLPGASAPTLVKPSVTLEMSRAACLEKVGPPDKKEWVSGSEDEEEKRKNG